MNVQKRSFGYYRSDRDPIPILSVEIKCMPQGAMKGVCRVVIGCAQPDGCKKISVDPNMEQFLSGGGSLWSHIRSP